MKFLKHVRSVRPVIGWIAGIAFVIVAAMELFLKKIPEKFEYGQESGEILYRICVSIVSSFIFYFFVVHLKAEKDKENISVYVAKKVKRIFGRCLGQLNDLAKHGGIAEDLLWDSADDINRIFLTINPNQPAPLIISMPITYATWLQYFDFYRSDASAAIDKIFRKMPFLDTELVALLGKLEDSTHFMMVGSGVGLPVRNTDMQAWASSFYDYVQICKEIRAYYQNKLASYE